MNHFTLRDHHLLNDDGYTHEACIAASTGIHDALTFAFRPILYEERQRIAQAIRRQADSKSATNLLAEVIAAHLVAWNLSSEITADAVQQLVPALFDKVYATLAGARSSEPLPTTGRAPEAFDEQADLNNLLQGVSLLLLHPGAAAIDCDQCVQWIYDLETGQRQTVRTGADRREVPQRRPAGVPTPCATCPKQSPARAQHLTLSAKNRRTYHLWRCARATHFHCVPNHLRSDPILARNFAHLDDVARRAELLPRSPEEDYP
ncbi:hypothetical protein AB1K70_19410 [Bremerella sp. JC770]|uniref:hypothetical protein n=1 Tax=Bremerella sp. JC770 TaxID=3232137 RepID=UPI003459DEAC